MDVVESWPDLDVFEERHPEDREDEHDQEEEQGDVDERRKGHDKRKQKSSDSFCAFDQTKDTTDFCNSHLKKWPIKFMQVIISIFKESVFSYVIIN